MTQGSKLVYLVALPSPQLASIIPRRCQKSRLRYQANLGEEIGAPEASRDAPEVLQLPKLSRPICSCCFVSQWSGLETHKEHRERTEDMC